jgi:anti-sigma regulatory factor (Ser/Thr protein kinase)
VGSKQRRINNTGRSRGEDVRRFILENVERHPTDIAKRVASHFRITRQAVHKHLSRLVLDGSLTETGQTRSRSYALAPLASWNRTYTLEATLAEDVVWMRDVRPELGQLPDNVLRIWQHGFTEMFNNAIDHSEGTKIHIEIRRTAATTEMIVADDGVGIFRKIQSRMGLLDERHAILELSKGKLTTDPTRHTGEGIFFTSRMFDSFDIVSGDVSFSHTTGEEIDWIRDNAQSATGTTVWMRLSNRTNRTTKKIFDQYVSGENYDFSRTVVPVVLAQYAGDPLVSRSQAKRVLARVDLFHTVVFDFSGVTSIGQAFADEIFRVFAMAHPDMELLFVHASVAVGRLIARARSTAGANVRSRATGKRRS